MMRKILCGVLLSAFCNGLCQANVLRAEQCKVVGADPFLETARSKAVNKDTVLCQCPPGFATTIESEDVSHPNVYGPDDIRYDVVKTCTAPVQSIAPAPKSLPQSEEQVQEEDQASVPKVQPVVRPSDWRKSILQRVAAHAGAVAFAGFGAGLTYVGVGMLAAPVITGAALFGGAALVVVGLSISISMAIDITKSLKDSTP